MTALYTIHYAPDNASLIVRLTLEEMRLPYRTVLVDRAQQAQKSAPFLALNPNGLIPVLETADGALFETGAILLWLADRHGAMAPPSDAPARGDFLKWLFFLSNTLHPELRMTFYPHQYAGSKTDAQQALKQTVRGRLCNHLRTLDDLAAGVPDWLRADAPSVLCYYLACLIRWMALYPTDEDLGWFDLAGYPHLHHLMCDLETRPAVAHARRAEGLGPAPFSAPIHASPPEGTAT
ncbi:glutathione S-transferase family protein [Arenibacterium sp. CAU 1754]